MNCDKYFNQINDYLNNELDANNKKEFENYLKQDSEFEKIVLDIKTNDILLKKLPLVKTKLNHNSINQYKPQLNEGPSYEYRKHTTKIAKTTKQT